MKFSKNDTLKIKGIAILMMYIHHFYLSADRYGKYAIDFFPLTEEMTVYIASALKICVAMFVFLTGYGMAVSYQSKEQKVLYIKYRLFSLLTHFVFIFLLVQAAAFPTGRLFEIYGKSGSSIIYFFIDMLGLARLFGTPTFIGTWWYMSLAVVLILLFPLLYKALEQLSEIAVLLIVLLPYMIGMDMSADLLRWIFPMLLGMYCAMNDCYSRIKEFEGMILGKRAGFAFFFLEIFIIAALIMIRQSEAGAYISVVIDGFLPMSITYFSLNYVAGIPVIGKLLEILGKHSMNMFLTHTLIRVTYFQDFSYGFGNAWLNILVFTIVTLILSLGIEQLKRAVRFDKITGIIGRKLNLLQ